MPVPPTRAGDPIRTGHLSIIGGNEDREGDMRVLRRFVELTGHPAPQLVVLTAAGGESIAASYERAFRSLGASRCDVLELQSREDARSPRVAERLLAAHGIFLTGEDPRRLLSVLGGTDAERALREAYARRGCSLGGTGAGASALSQHMLVEGGETSAAATLAAGLGLVQQVVIDHRFSERRRLGQLLDAVAGNPTLIGIGIDEDTALVIDAAGGIEVVGDGAVTLLDGRGMSSSLVEGVLRSTLELIDVRLHLLPSGARYSADASAPPTASSRRLQPRALPAGLQDIVALLTGTRSLHA